MDKPFDTTNAIDVTDGYIPTFGNWMKMLKGLELFMDVFDEFSPEEIQRIKEVNIELCEFINNLPHGSEQKLRITNQLRSLLTSLYDKGGNARIIYMNFPNIHEGDENQEKRRGRAVKDRMKAPQGW